MAGEYYSLKETAENLKVTESEVMKLVQEGRLKNSGSEKEPLFKISDVKALIGQKAIEEEIDLDTSESETDTSSLGLVDLGKEPGETGLGAEASGILDGILDENIGLPAQAPTEAPTEETSLHIAVAETPATRRIVYETGPDAASNIFGLSIFATLTVILFTTIITVAAISGFTPGILTRTKNIIWPILLAMGGLLSFIWLALPKILTMEKKSKKPEAGKEKVPPDKKPFSFFRLIKRSK